MSVRTRTHASESTISYCSKQSYDSTMSVVNKIGTNKHGVEQQAIVEKPRWQEGDFIVAYHSYNMSKFTILSVANTMSAGLIESRTHRLPETIVYYRKCP